MIKLVASDIDGTLVKDGHNELNPRMKDIIYELKEKGIIFVAASGRQYRSMENLFKDIKDEVIFIAENGAYVVCRDREIAKHPMDRRLATELIKEVRELEDSFITVSTKETMYIETRDEHFTDLLINGYKNELSIVDDVLDLDSTIIKVAIYRKDGIDQVAKKMTSKWDDKFKVTIAGGRWLDFMDLSVDKGVALSEIQELLNIGIDETMAFGDNINDLGMLKRAKESYAMGNARPEVKSTAKHIADTNLNNGVIKVLENLI